MHMKILSNTCQKYGAVFIDNFIEFSKEKNE